MTRGRTYLGLDLGTSALKAVVIDARGEVLAETRADYPLSTPAPGWVEADPDSWFEAARTAVADLPAGDAPSAIGLSGQMHGLVVTDPDGRPLRPAILWPDTRAVPQLDRYRRLPREATRRLANPLAPGMAGPLLCWLDEHEPACLQDTRWALQPKDWLRLLLTGEAGSEPSDASATLLYDVAGDRWDPRTLEELGLDPGQLPSILPSASTAGHLDPKVADLLGLPRGIPVAAGAADTAAACVGTGLRSPTTVQLTIGTGGQLVRPLATPVADPQTGTHLYRAATRGWYAMAATLNAGLALERVRALVGASWDELYASADAIRSEDPVFLPHLAGERTPHLEPRLRGGWVELSLDHDRASLLRSALEGVAHAIRDAFDALPETGAVDLLRLAGGGSRHPAWRQLLADVLARQLHAVEVPSASGRGAALLAALAVDEVSEDDVYGPLAPPAVLVAEPREDVAPLRAERLERFRSRVATELATLRSTDGAEPST